MSSDTQRTSRLNLHYREFLLTQDADAFQRAVTERFTIGTLERLAVAGRRETRRAAVFALGLLGDYSSNPVVGCALVDGDRGVRRLAEEGIVRLWQRCGTEPQQNRLAQIIRQLANRQYEAALRQCDELLSQAPWYAEAWNQRAIAHYQLEQFEESIGDCHQALELNPYHFGAAAGMGQCYVHLGDFSAALECFRRALKLNPNLEGIRASVNYLERTLKEGK